MALADNRPDLARLKRQLTGANLLDASGAPVGDPVLQEILDASIAWIEDVAATAFNGRQITELRDGNGTNSMVLFKRPATSAQLVKVELPVLALTRTYTTQEIKLYPKQGHLTVFTYKLAAEQASLHLDQMVYGNIFPTLPQCVTITYTYGFPQFDAAAQTTQLGPGVVLAGDTRDPELTNWLTGLQQAAICDAAASVLAQLGGLTIGTLQSVSFDGFSQTLNPQAYGPQVQALVQRRDELLERRRRRVFGTVGS